MMTDAPLPNLKPVEGEVLSMLARGYKVASMAQELNISRNYVYLLMRELRLRFLVASNAALVSRAIANGIIQPDGTVIIPLHASSFQTTRPN